jgi:hypothetical protein
MDGRSARPIRRNLCVLCQHPRRAEVESLIVAGAALRAVAKRFGGGLNKDNLSRHMRSHVTRERRAELMIGPAKVTELASAAADESRSLLEQLSIVRSILMNAFINAAEAGDRGQVANLSGRLLESLRELGRLTGELRELSGISVTNNVVNLFASPEFTRLQEGLLRVARAHPAVRADIVALLRTLDATSSEGGSGALPARAGMNGSSRPDMAAGGLPMRPGAPLIEGEAIHVAVRGST